MTRDYTKSDLAHTEQRRKEAREAREFIASVHQMQVDWKARRLRELNRERAARSMSFRAVRA